MLRLSSVEIKIKNFAFFSLSLQTMCDPAKTSENPLYLGKEGSKSTVSGQKKGVKIIVNLKEISPLSKP